MFRKEPAGIEYWSPEYPAECANRQQKILASAMKMLKPGGTLVYSTCTFAPEEDEQNISWLLNNYPDLKLIPIEKASGMDETDAEGYRELVLALSEATVEAQQYNAELREINQELNFDHGSAAF